MKILQILPELNEGGVERGTVDLAVALASMGNKAIVISNGGRLTAELNSDNIKHYNLPVHRKSLFTIVRMVSKVARIIEEEKVDVIHARSRVPAWIAFFAYQLYLRRIAKNNTISSPVFITTCHGYYRPHFFSQIMGWGKFVIVISPVIGKHMRERFGVPFHRIKFIPRGVDFDVFKYKQLRLDLKSGCRVGIVGRITQLKGHTYFLKAMSRVVREIPKVKIIVAGESSPNKADYMKELELLVRQLGLERYIEFTGHVDNVVELMHSLDLLVLATTTAEAFGRVLIEAGACGVPIVATQVGGVVDIVKDGFNGLIVPPQDIPEMSKAVIELLKDRNVANEFSLKGRKFVEDNFGLRQMVDKTIAVYQEAIKVQRILLIKYSALGDVILASPSLRAVRNRFPDASITVLTSRQAREVISRMPYVNDVIVYDRGHYASKPKALIEVGRILRSNSFDLVIDLQNNKASHILSFLSMSPRRLGYNNGKLSFLMNIKAMDDYSKISPIEHQFRLLGLLGIKYQDEKLELPLTNEDEDFVTSFLEKQWLAPSQLLIGMNLGSSTRWISKRWPLDRFVYLADELASRGMRIVITGSSEDREDVKNFIKMTRSKPINACGETTIMQLTALIKRCVAYVTGDSAPLHIAMAVNTPVVALFGPTDFRRHVAYLNENITILRKEVFCSPCYRPICKDYDCMHKITVQEVLDALFKLINK
ncbi:MAG: lipopolysaccharide heptosyltransferase II [Candidatus Omnitrophica bacterium]|nr:lipopolysaccharide heptosyltransferase II [Candidatus Omnitrophota bacterium]